MTAVEWLQNELFTEEYMRNNLFEIFEHAKEMEKQQIKDAYESGYQDGDAILGYEYFDNSESYYKKTYKNNDNE